MNLHLQAINRRRLAVNRRLDGRLAVNWWQLAGDGNAHILGGRRLQALAGACSEHFTAPYSTAAPSAPYNFNNNECLQHADSVYNGQTKSTWGRPILQTAWVFPTDSPTPQYVYNTRVTVGG